MLLTIVIYTYIILKPVRIGTIANFFPPNSLTVVLHIGVSISWSANSKFLVDVFNKANENMTCLAKNLLSYKRNKINGALANFLLHYGEKGCLNFLKQKEISDVLGYSRENINKCLNNFTAEGYIEYTDEKIKILNTEALISIKKFG